MDVTQNRFYKGMSSDVNDGDAPEGSYQIGRNIRINGKEGEDYTITTHNGTQLAFDLGSYAITVDGVTTQVPKTIVGAKEFNGVVFLLVAADVIEGHPQYGLSEIGCYPSPRYYSNSGDGYALQYAPLKVFCVGNDPCLNNPHRSVVSDCQNSAVSLTISSLVTTKLNLRIDHMNEVQLKLEDDNSVNIYFTDYDNPFRVINCGFDVYTGNSVKKYVWEYDFEHAINIYNETDKFPKLLYSKSVDGVLPFGNYHFYARYSNRNGNYTSWYLASPVTAITESDYELEKPFGIINHVARGFGSDGIVASSKGVRLQASNLDPSYEYIEIAYSLSHNGGAIHKRILKKIQMDCSYFSADSYIDVTGMEDAVTIPVDELTTAKPIDTKYVKSIFTEKSYMYGANWKSDKFYDDILKEFFCKIRIREKSVEVNGFGANCDNGGYEYTNRERDIAHDLNNSIGVFSGEVYCMGAVPMFKNGIIGPFALPLTGGSNYDGLLDYDTPTSGMAINADGIYRVSSMSSVPIYKKVDDIRQQRSTSFVYQSAIILTPGSVVVQIDIPGVGWTNRLDCLSHMTPYLGMTPAQALDAYFITGDNTGIVNSFQTVYLNSALCSFFGQISLNIRVRNILTLTDIETGSMSTGTLIYSDSQVPRGNMYSMGNPMCKKLWFDTTKARQWLLQTDANAEREAVKVWIRTNLAGWNYVSAPRKKNRIVTGMVAKCFGESNMPRNQEGGFAKTRNVCMPFFAGNHFFANGVLASSSCITLGNGVHGVNSNSGFNNLRSSIGYSSQPNTGAGVPTQPGFNYEDNYYIFGFNKRYGLYSTDLFVDWKSIQAGRSFMKVHHASDWSQGFPILNEKAILSLYRIKLNGTTFFTHNHTGYNPSNVKAFSFVAKNFDYNSANTVLVKGEFMVDPSETQSPVKEVNHQAIQPFNILPDNGFASLVEQGEPVDGIRNGLYSDLGNNRYSVNMPQATCPYIGIEVPSENPDGAWQSHEQFLDMTYAGLYLFDPDAISTATVKSWYVFGNEFFTGMARYRSGATINESSTPDTVTFGKTYHGFVSLSDVMANDPEKYIPSEDLYGIDCFLLTTRFKYLHSSFKYRDGDIYNSIKGLKDFGNYGAAIEFPNECEHNWHAMEEVSGNKSTQYSLNEKWLEEVDKPETEFYNDGYSRILDYKSWPGIDKTLPVSSERKNNRVRVSSTQVDGAVFDSYREWKPLEYKDYTPALGSINKVIGIRGAIYIIHDTGIVYVPTDQRTMNANGENVSLGDPGALPSQYIILSSTVGSRHQWSVFASDNAIYGFSIDRKVIWRLSGQEVEDLTQKMGFVNWMEDLYIRFRNEERNISFFNNLGHGTNFELEMLDDQPLAPRTQQGYLARGVFGIFDPNMKEVIFSFVANSDVPVLVMNKAGDILSEAGKNSISFVISELNGVALGEHSYSIGYAFTMGRVLFSTDAHGMIFSGGAFVNNPLRHMQDGKTNRSMVFSHDTVNLIQRNANVGSLENTYAFNNFHNHKNGFYWDSLTSTWIAFDPTRRYGAMSFFDFIIKSDANSVIELANQILNSNATDQYTMLYASEHQKAMLSFEKAPFWMEPVYEEEQWQYPVPVNDEQSISQGTLFSTWFGQFSKYMKNTYLYGVGGFMRGKSIRQRVIYTPFDDTDGTNLQRKTNMVIRNIITFFKRSI